MVVCVMQIFGLCVVGVDMFEVLSGLQVMEVNLLFGLQGIEMVMKIDVVGVIVDYVVDQICFFEFDICQCLMVLYGYGVVEFLIFWNFLFVGKMVVDLGFVEQDICILNVMWDGDVIVVFKGYFELCMGD